RDLHLHSSERRREGDRERRRGDVLGDLAADAGRYRSRAEGRLAQPRCLMMRRIRGGLGLRRWFAGLCVAGVLACGAAQAQTYPSKAITIVCAQPPGSGPDTMARLFSAVMARRLNQPVLVVNQPGAGGVLAANRVAQALPDGYTLLLALGGMHTIAAAMQK